MLTFRRATAADAPALRFLATTIWRAYYPPIIGAAQVEYMLPLMYSEEKIAREIADGAIWEFAELDTVAIGFLSLATESPAKAKLNKLYLLPEHHGRGLGRTMIARAISVASDLGATEITLQVNRNNTRAIDAYHRAGFTCEREAVFDIGSGFIMDDYILTRSTNPLD